MEFNHPDETAKAANCSDHFINGRKASVQFFKAKDALQPKRESPAHDNMEQFETPFKTNGLVGAPTHYGMPTRMTPFEVSHLSNRQVDYRSPKHQEPSYYNPAAYQTELYSQLRPSIVEPKIQKQPEKKDFYASLRVAQEGRQQEETYAPQNLRFNRKRLC